MSHYIHHESSPYFTAANARPLLLFYFFFYFSRGRAKRARRTVAYMYYEKKEEEKEEEASRCPSQPFSRIYRREGARVLYKAARATYFYSAAVAAAAAPRSFARASFCFIWYIYIAGSREALIYFCPFRSFHFFS